MKDAVASFGAQVVRFMASFLFNFFSTLDSQVVRVITQFLCSWYLSCAIVFSTKRRRWLFGAQVVRFMASFFKTFSTLDSQAVEL